MKPALVYYGGKQNLLKHIIPNIPDHKVYCEPFCGGATVFFAKKSSSVEVINDIHSELVNFYRVLKDPVESQKLYIMCDKTLYSREEHFNSLELYKNGSNVEKAWALWYKVNTGFSGKLNGGFSKTKSPGSSPTQKFNNLKHVLRLCGERLENAQIEHVDAIECIKSYDSEDTFFYIDPPYVGADQGHYSGYTKDDFTALMDSLCDISGKFLLSHYPNEDMNAFVKIQKWHSYSVDQKVRAKNPFSNMDNKQPVKTEVFVSNYPLLAENQMDLFEDQT